MRALAIALLLAGCSSAQHAVDGGAACEASSYPCGPFGFAQGARIANLTIDGQRDANHSGSAVDDPVAPIQLADYFADPKLSMLAIIIGAESCVPCQNEQPNLVTLYDNYLPGGKVAFLEAIVQNASGQPADQTVIDNWATRYNLPFDISHDPTQALAPYYPVNTFPSAMAIRLADMTIVYQVTGPATGLQSAIDSNLQSR